MLELIKKYPQLLLFGILTALFSSPGQTFLISFFLPPMRETFGLSQAGMGMLYFFATTASAFLLPFTGKLLDRTDLTHFTLIAGFLLACGCVVLGLSSGAFMIAAGFLLIRNLGQGTLTMISSTTMAKVFGPLRGKALGISNLGYPLSEACFPFMVTLWISRFGWRSGWFLLAGLVVLFFSPAVFFLLRKERHERTREAVEGCVVADGPEALRVETGVKELSVKEMLRDRRFYLLLLPMLATPGLLTALFFHQGAFMEWKGWDLKVVSLAFIGFAGMRALASFIAGPLVDKFSARRVYPWNLYPLIAGLFCLWLGKPVVWVYLYLGLAGTTMGISMTVSSALWPELFGTKHLGAIRGFLGSVVVFATAATPPLTGALLDGGVPMSFLLGGMLILTGLGAFLAQFGCREMAA